MRFLIKAGFWFTMVLLALPFTEGTADKPVDAQTQVQVIETIAAARVAVEDIRGICERKPAVCEVGSETIDALGSRASEGARIAYTFLDSRFGDRAPRGADQVVTGTVSTADAASIEATATPRPSLAAATEAREPETATSNHMTAARAVAALGSDEALARAARLAALALSAAR